MHTPETASELSNRLRATIDRELPNLKLVSERADAPLRAGGWSAKQELGHLIDSATNNHVRFVRAALDGLFEGPSYDQTAWVRLHGYERMPWDSLVEMWYRYNHLLSELLNELADVSLEAPCRIGTLPETTLRQVARDYILHMQHHLDQILLREQPLPYPQQQADC